MTRRSFGLLAGSALLAGTHRSASAKNPRPIGLVLAPSNLGLRPENGQEPGTWRAPQVLEEAGLATALGAADVVRLERPKYEIKAQPGTRLRNGRTLRVFSLSLADAVRRQLAAGRFPVVIGGDCGILLGCLYASRQAGGRGLVHVDGHSDFTQEKSYATPETLGSVAGMDLALASGRGEAIMTAWPGIEGPLAADADIVQIGERSMAEPWFKEYYGDILATQITRITTQEALVLGIDAAARQAIGRLEDRGLDRVWLHVDLDVLDEKVMPAVDSPGAPGFDYEQVSRLVGALVASGRIAGADFTIYDPDRDPKLQYARPLAACIARGIRA